MTDTDTRETDEGQAGVVTTIGERCRRCYTCVRHCPAKAIMVQDGRAKVLAERCVACGNCIRVCAQNAKRVVSDDLEMTKAMVEAGEHVVACLAPSFPGIFAEVEPTQVVEAARRLGFAQVMEVAVGAELVARAYQRVVAESGNGKPLITTPCPALVSYVEKHIPGLLPYLAPVVSPMVAMGRLIKQRLNPAAKVVFIGPCLAKKVEAKDPNLGDEIDAVLTFRELEEWLSDEQIELASLAASEPDPPYPTVGRIFPVPGGLLKASAMQADVLDNDIVVTEGVERITELLRQIDARNVDARFFDLLFCEGCISGPFAGDQGNTVALKQKVADFAKHGIASHRDTSLAGYDDLDLSRAFADCHVETAEPTEAEIRAILAQTDKFRPEDELNCGACGYPSCREKAAAVYNGLAESEMCLPYLIDKLERTISDLNDSRRDLLEAEEQLMHSEKLASMGQLAAGVAHEINNPLGTVLIYTHMMLKGLPQDDSRRADLEVVTREADRCRNIVRGLLDFSRQSKLNDELTDVNEVLRGTLDLLDKQGDFEQIELEVDLDEAVPKTLLDPDQMRQVFINILENAVEAMPQGGRVRVSSGLAADRESISVRVADTGVGIPEENLEKIFHPFFTTKQIGRGTGLGLAIVYGIVKMHRGSISVDSKMGVGTTFTVSVPALETREARRAL